MCFVPKLQRNFHCLGKYTPKKTNCEVLLDLASSGTLISSDRRKYFKISRKLHPEAPDDAQ